MSLKLIQFRLPSEATSLLTYIYRYRRAQVRLVGIMKARGATLGCPILRPTLREEARKQIGDTGLLDHLLKHMTDMVVSSGERFRRRHNNEGAMEYWLEDAGLLQARKVPWLRPLLKL